MEPLILVHNFHLHIKICLYKTPHIFHTFSRPKLQISTPNFRSKCWVQDILQHQFCWKSNCFLNAAWMTAKRMEFHRFSRSKQLIPQLVMKFHTFSRVKYFKSKTRYFSFSSKTHTLCPAKYTLFPQIKQAQKKLSLPKETCTWDL